MKRALLLGGFGSLTSGYRACARRHQVILDHWERGLPVRGCWDWVLLCVGCCSHRQMDGAKELADTLSATLRFLRRPSLACLGEALQGLRGAT